jgi:lysophospholipase L1-like esterase
VPSFPDTRLRQAGISPARVAQLQAQYNAMTPPQQAQFRGIVASRPDEVLRRTYDPNGVPAAATTTADVVADPALLTAVQTAILAAHDTDTEREAFVPARLADSALRMTVGSQAVRAGALDGSSLIVCGDSRVQAFDAEGTATTYGAFRNSWALLLAVLSGGSIRLDRNAGHGGYTSRQLQPLFAGEVIARKPTLVGLQFGRNDGQTAGYPDDMLAVMGDMIDQCRAAGIGVFALNNTPQGQAALGAPSGLVVEQVDTTSGTLPAGTHTYVVTAGNGSATTQTGESLPSAPVSVTTAAPGTNRLYWAHVKGANWYKVYKDSGTTRQALAYTNYSGNPNWQQIGTGNGGSNGTGGVSTNSRPTDGGHAGTTYLRRTWTTGTTAVGGGISGARSNPFPAGSKVSARDWVRCSKTQRIQGLWTFTDSGGATVGTTAVTLVLTPGTWTAFELTGYAAPATAVAATFSATAVAGTSAANWATGDTLDLDDELITTGTTLPGSNFDGDTPAAGGTSYAWTGSAGTSPSTMSTTVPVYGLAATVAPSSSPGFAVSKRYTEAAAPTLGAAAPSVDTTAIPSTLNANNERINAAMAALCAARNVPLIDAYSVLADPLTGMYRTGLTFDGTHPNGAGHALIAKEGWRVLGPLVKPKATPLTRSQLDTTLNLNPNPLFGAVTGNAPSSYTVNVNTSTWDVPALSHVTGPVAGILGNAYTISASKRVQDGMASPLITTGFAPGDHLLVGWAVSVALASNGDSFDTQLQDQNGATIRQARFVEVDIAGPVIFADVIVPAGVTGLKLVTSAIGFGGASIGQFSVYNKTSNAWLTILSDG